jgi:hypothetical protein
MCVEGGQARIVGTRQPAKSAAPLSPAGATHLPLATHPKKAYIHGRRTDESPVQPLKTLSAQLASPVHLRDGPALCTTSIPPTRILTDLHLPSCRLSSANQLQIQEIVNWHRAASTPPRSEDA